MTGDNTSQRRADRRRFLKLTGAMAASGSIGFAGCIGDDPEDDAAPDPTPDPDPDPSDDEPDTDDEPEETIDYPTQDIRWIVPYSTGGGFDAYSRGVAEFMPDHLPNDVNVVVENVPGAGGRTGANTTYRADPDGYTIGIFNVPGMVTTQLVLDTEYDLAEVSWIGRIGAENYVLAVGADSDFQTLEDMQQADEVTFAVTGAGGTSDLVTAIGADVLELNARTISGYEGSTEARTGVIRGDADARMVTYSNAVGHVEDGDMRVIVALDSAAPDFAPDADTVVDHGYDEIAGMGIQRPVGGPPGIDDEIIDILETALMDTLEDDEFVAWAEDAGRPIDPAGREETAQIILNTQQTFEQYRDILEDFV